MSDGGPRPLPSASGLVSVARFLASTRAEGPGERTAVWVQGCTIRCAGCFNPHMWTFRGGEGLAPDDLAARILHTGTDGLTLLGGEPFDQAAALAEVATAVRRAGRSVMTFTGYTSEQLREAVAEGREDVAALLGETDLLVAGPFLRDRIDTVRPWVGSANQEFIALSDRFPHLLDDVRREHDRIEISVDASGQIAVNGWAELELLDELLSSLGRNPPARPPRGASPTA
ncbi:4Fe-4S single cluster domain-containing protein [Micromonospora profundi]|uniref:4Fe-4S single cluster domain-containing protein n=1 Tax=Micromonospora profundi TaxID=1420889 RepID=A0AAJ6L3M9_9ACTN|nr:MULTISPECIES: 4Fe-4S single cluster domain-containing protein [Micromonospora]KOX05599.1 ribonucleoside-triphosphate reductase activating protein [Micromonospora sp. NRRL B-16802]WLS46436.1 4Fe-4S single cluster domain-containing protein [Micromonospora profundi]